MQRSLKLWPQANSGQYQTMGALKKLQDQSHGVVETSTSMSKHVAALHIYTIDTNSQQLQRNCSAKMQRNWRCNGRLPAWKRFCWNDNCGPGLSKVLDVTNLYYSCLATWGTSTKTCRLSPTAPKMPMAASSEPKRGGSYNYWKQNM